MAVCAHTSCTCEAAEGSDYCSEWCAGHPADAECHCHHAGCEAPAPPLTATMGRTDMDGTGGSGRERDEREPRGEREESAQRRIERKRHEAGDEERDSADGPGYTARPTRARARGGRGHPARRDRMRSRAFGRGPPTLVGSSPRDVTDGRAVGWRPPGRGGHGGLPLSGRALDRRPPAVGAARVGGRPRRGFVVAISRVGAETSNNVDLPGTGSQKATDLLADQFPPQQNGTNPIVFHVDSGKITDSDNEKAINQAAKAIQGMPDVVSAPSPFSDDSRRRVHLEGQDRPPSSPVLLDISSADLDEDEAQAVLDAAEKPAEPLGMEVAAGGSIGSELSTPATESSELVGIIVAMIILTLAFGSIVAMGMPIISAVVGLAVGLTGIGLVGHLFAVPDIGPTLAIMIGLGVGIDYALFLVSRHRAQLAEGEEMQRVDRPRARHVGQRDRVRRRDGRDRARLAGGGRDPARVLARVLVGHRRPDRRARGDHPAPGRHVPGRAPHPLPLACRRSCGPGPRSRGPATGRAGGG